jgi:polyisoprenoid-binding protein YceI
MAPRLPLPKTKRGRFGAIAGVVVTVAVAGFAFIYFVLFPTSSPPSFSLKAPRTVVPLSSDAAVVGRWTIASGSQAGYRVREKLAFLPALDDAVGRTSEITGGATFAAAHGTLTVTAASFVINVLSLKSNEPMRDAHIQTIGIQSATYPKASFVLKSPVTLPANALSGSVFAVKVSGDVNMHGTTRLLTIPVDMRLASSGIRAVGSLTFPWGLFRMTAPSVGGFVSVEPTATMEFDLRLARS